jgi:hypothetical protein
MDAAAANRNRPAHVARSNHRLSLASRPAWASSWACFASFLPSSFALSHADVFRRAIALYRVAKRAEMGDGHVIIRTKEGTEQELISL